MALRPERQDITQLPDLLHGRSRAGPVRQQRPVYVDLLPPCNAGCPAEENIQAWLAHAEAGDHERAWRQLVSNVYVARVAMGADPQQTLRAFREAEAYDGPSLIIAYSHCIAHGIEMRDGLDQQYRAVASGYWPLVRYDPMVRAAGGNPFLLDSPRPRIALADYTKRELRYRALVNTHPAEAERLGILAQEAVNQRWDTYEDMATRGAHQFPADARKDR
jgi:hypothetical protein